MPHHYHSEKTQAPQYVIGVFELLQLRQIDSGVFRVFLSTDQPSQQVLPATSFPVFCEFETSRNRVADPCKVCVGIHCTAVFILYFVKGKVIKIFMRTSKGRWAKAVAAYNVSYNPPLETHHRKAVGLRWHSWATEQAPQLLSPVKRPMTPAERLAFGNNKQDPGGR